jgi:tetratricopeptide (TPR) repeat protein
MSTPEEQPESISPEAEARIRELQALITESQRRADKSRDEDVREALNMQASALGLRVVRLKRGLPEEGLPEEEAEQEEELEPLPVPTPDQLREADLLVQRAMLESRRGNKQAASDLLKKAVEAAPGASSVLEALGDDYLERKQYLGAVKSYRDAVRADPNNASAERKFAKVSAMGAAHMSIEDQLRMGLSDSTMFNPDDALANPKWAPTLSFFIPGSGQMALGLWKKGIVMFVVFVVSMTLFIVLNKTLNVSHGRLPTIAYVPMGIGIIAWFASVADALSLSKGNVEKRPPPSKPQPPVNLPFE